MNESPRVSSSPSGLILETLGRSQSRLRYTEEFKIEAVKQVLERLRQNVPAQLARKCHEVE